MKLSSDFVSSEAVLMKKKPDKYEDGIIKYSLITDTVVSQKNYKTIFPSDSTIKSIINWETEIHPKTLDGNCL